MKLIDILETVVNLADVRNRKKVDALAKEFDQYEQLEVASNNAFGRAHTEISKQLDQFRIPGFTGIDDILGYLLGDVGLPRNTWPKVWNDWFTHLPQEDKARVQMIGHHVPRLFSKFQSMLDQITAFEEQWKAEFDKLPTAKAPPRVFDTTRGLKEEIQEILDRLNVLRVMLPQLTS